MNKIMCGIKNTGTPHIGNLINIIIPMINMINNDKNKKNIYYILIADLHKLTNNLYNKKNSIYKIVATWLACGINIKNVIFFKQSSIPEVTELFWYLS